MAWSAPFTAVAGAVLTAAQVNTFIRDNLNETMPAKATAPGSIFAVTGVGQIAERHPDVYTDLAQVDITSTSFDNPSTGSPGPSVTATTGIAALVSFRAAIRVPSPTARVEMSYAISGATDRPASTTRAVGNANSSAAGGLFQRIGSVDLATVLTPGENTFTMQYAVSSGTGLAVDRRLWVLPL